MNNREREIIAQHLVYLKESTESDMSGDVESLLNELRDNKLEELFNDYSLLLSDIDDMYERVRKRSLDLWIKDNPDEVDFRNEWAIRRSYSHKDYYNIAKAEMLVEFEEMDDQESIDLIR